MLVAAFNEPPPPPAAPADVPIRNCEAQQRYSERDTCPSSVEEDSNTELNRLGGVGDTQEPGWQSQSSKNTRRRGGRARGEETGPKIGGASSVAAAAAAGDGISEEMKLRKARAAGSLGLTTLRCSWGTVQEAATLRVLCDIFPESEVCEVGLCAFDPGTLPSAWGIDPGSLPPLGASPDGLIRHPATGAVGGDLLEAMSQLHVVQANSGECGHGSAVGDIVEVVEVKNTCPFDYSPAARSRGKRRFAVSDRGPRDRIDPVWVPQLQLHMLCAGTQSALLVSRSVTLGLRIFRMPRDDRYLQTMLRLVSKLWQDHALRRRPPPRDVYGRLSEHKELLKRTKELAAAAVVVREVPPEEVALPGRDMRFFLD